MGSVGHCTCRIVTLNPRVHDTHVRLCVCFCACVCRKHRDVQLRAGLQGSVPCPAPQAAASPDGVQVVRQGPPDLPALHGRQRRLPAAPDAQPGPRGDLWRGHCGNISSLPPGQDGLDRHSAAGAGQVRGMSVISFVGDVKCQGGDQQEELSVGYCSANAVLPVPLNVLADLEQAQQDCVLALSAWPSLFPLSVKWRTTPIVFTSSWRRRLGLKQVSTLDMFCLHSQLIVMLFTKTKVYYMTNIIILTANESP